jgi:transposase
MPVYAGIDVCKERLDVYLHPLDQSWSVANDAAGRQLLRRRLTKEGITLVVMEPTSKYHRACHRHLDAAGIAVALVNPLRSRLFAEACGQLAKTDAIDARMLALMAERLQPEAAAPPSAIEEELQELANARSTAVADRVALANRMETTTNPLLRRDYAARLKSLARHIERIEARITALIASDPVTARRAAILRSIPGVGPANVVAILALLREIGRISSKKITALAGLAPFARDSGPSKGRRSIRGGRAELRRYLYMAAVSASRCNPELKRFYHHLIASGKPAKLALTAVARKLIVMANTLVSENRLWTPERP